MAHPASGYVVVSAGALIVRDASRRCTSARVALGGLASGPLRTGDDGGGVRGQSPTVEIISAAAAKAAEGSSPDERFFTPAPTTNATSQRCWAQRAIESAAQRAAG